MRITYVGPVPPFRGGISQSGARLVEALADLGHEVCVLSWGAQYPRLLYPGEQRDESARPFPGARFELAWWNPASWWQAGRQAKQGDLVLFPWVTPLQAAAYRTIVAASAPTKAAAIVHNPRPHERRPMDRALTSWALSGLEGAVVHSGAAARDLRSWVANIRVVVSPLPPTLDVRPAPLPPGPPYRLLFLGLVRAYKGLDAALEALAVLRRRGVPVELTVTGQFWEAVEPWRRRIEAAGLTDVVALRPGYVPDPEVEALLASHHAILAPYRTATQSALVPVAYAAGRPVVATDVGGLAEQVEEGVTGTLAPAGDSEALADAVERLLAALPALAEGARVRRSSWLDLASAALEAGTGRREAAFAAGARG